MMRSGIRIGTSLLAALLVGSATAQENRTLLLNEDRLRIGDSEAEPKPVGTTWSVAFTLDDLPKWAILSVEASDSSYENTVTLNGALLGLIRNVPSGQWLKTEFELQRSHLRRGENRLDVKSVAKRNNYDDFNVREVALVLGATDPPSVTSLSITRGVPGATVWLQGERFDPEKSRVFLGDAPVSALFTAPTQALIRVPTALTPGVYPLTVRTDGPRSAPVEFTLLAGSPVYAPISLSGGGSVGPAGDVAPKPGTGGRTVGDGQLTIADTVRLLRRVLGLEPDPWP